MSLSARSGVPRLATLSMRTPSISLLTMREATGTEAVPDFVPGIRAGTGWQLAGVRKRASRLEPPHAYWVIHEATINKDGEERKLRLVARGAFDTGAWEALRERLVAEGAGRRCDPINSIGYPAIIDEGQARSEEHTSELQSHS